MQLEKDSWAEAAVLVFSTVLAIIAAEVLLAAVFGFNNRVPEFGAIAFGMFVNTLIRIRLSKGTWRFFKRSDHF